MTDKPLTDAASPSCPACGTSRVAAAFVKERYAHHRCRSCGTLFVFPLPSDEEVAAFYRRNSGEQTSTICWNNSRRHLWGLWDWTLDAIASSAGQGPVLDVGCGTGQFIEYAQKKGWLNLAGVELSGEAARQARQLTGVSIETVPVQDARLPADSFAGVVMWDVIEHLADMRAVVREARRLLRPDGLLVLSTPNSNGFTMRLLGSRAMIVMPPEHLTYFSVAGARAFFAAEGFHVEHAHTMDIYLREWTRSLKRTDADAVAGRSDEEREAYQRRYQQVTKASPLMTLMNAANAVLKGTGLGDQLIVSARKIPA